MQKKVFSGFFDEKNTQNNSIDFIVLNIGLYILTPNFWTVVLLFMEYNCAI